MFPLVRYVIMQDDKIIQDTLPQVKILKLISPFVVQFNRTKRRASRSASFGAVLYLASVSSPCVPLSVFRLILIHLWDSRLVPSMLSCAGMTA